MSKKKKIITIILIILGILLISCSGVFCYFNNALNQVKYITEEDKKNEKIVEETFETIDEFDPTIETKDEKLNWDTAKYIPETTGIKNILLCGEENQGGGVRGRSDSMILVSINMKQKKIRLINFMRDMYVPIEGHSNNKLNAAYAIGGMPLLESTIENDFGINIDGYVLVDFENFEKVINLLDGVDIELSQKEADYLNETNYVDDESFRTLVAGKNHMNGNQALGYSRVRYVSTPNGLSNDFGRNWRQRQVLISLFNKYKDISYMDMVTILPDILNIITTDITKDELIQIGINVLSLKNIEIEQTFVPFNGKCYQDAYVNKMSVLYITDIDEIQAKLQYIINGGNIDFALNNTIKKVDEDKLQATIKVTSTIKPEICY